MRTGRDAAPQKQQEKKGDKWWNRKRRERERERGLKPCPSEPLPRSGSGNFGRPDHDPNTDGMCSRLALPAGDTSPPPWNTTAWPSWHTAACTKTTSSSEDRGQKQESEQEAARHNVMKTHVILLRATYLDATLWNSLLRARVRVSNSFYD